MTQTGKKPTPAEMYAQYFVPAIFKPWSRVLLELAAPQPGERVLDLACGTGVVARHAAPAVGASGRVVGLDISPDMLDVAGRLSAPEGAAIEWKQGSADSLPLPERAFELALCQQGLQFCPDRGAAAREVRRVLAPGGRAVVSVWKSLEHHPVYEALLEAEARHLGVSVSELATPFSFGDPDELRATLEGAGFGRVELTERSREVSFPSPERFVELTTLAGVAVVPASAEGGPAAQAELVEAVQRESADVVARHRDGDYIRFEMPTHIATAATS